MRFSRRSTYLLRGAVAVTLAFIYLPLAVIAIYAFSSANILEWPPPGLTTHWFSKAFGEAGPRDAFVTSIEEASADLGADPWQTFRFVTVPTMRTALAAGALLAFALSFDEIIVTLFTIGGQETLPIWIFNNLFRPTQLPIVNVVAVVVVLLSIIPVYLAHRLTRDEEGVATVRGGPTAEAGAQI